MRFELEHLYALVNVRHAGDEYGVVAVFVSHSYPGLVTHLRHHASSSEYTRTTVARAPPIAPPVNADDTRPPTVACAATGFHSIDSVALPVTVPSVTPGSPPVPGPAVSSFPSHDCELGIWLSRLP